VNTMQRETLTERFRRFCRELPGAEWVDDLDLTDGREGVRRADAFFSHREIVAEVKTIQTDQEPRLKSLLSELVADERWPLFVGQWPLDRVAHHIPIPADSQEASWKILERAAGNWVRGANRQIRDTKVAFGLNMAKGLLVILNDEVALWQADTIATAVGFALIRRKPDGSPWFDQIAGVWIVDEAHFLVQGTTRLYPNVEIPNPAVPGCEELMSFLGQIREPWSAFCGVPNAGELSGIDLSQLEDVEGERPDSPLPMHKVFVAEYRDNRYLRDLAEPALLGTMAVLFLELCNRLGAEGALPFRYRKHVEEVAFRLGVATGKTATSLSRVDSVHLLRTWFHGLQELGQRCVDLRAIAAYLPQRRA